MPENAKTVEQLHIILERDKNKIYQRINEVEDKHDTNYADLKLILTTFIETQKPLSKMVESIDNELKKLNSNVTDITRRVDKVEGKVTAHDEVLEKRSNANTTIIVAVIGSITTFGSAALGFSQIFFK
ncbi:hypothetical protein LAU42_07075 [Macrococcus armenti]|uniref:hypothetical protein n=1 Tax=Macrococcus armenti TaxID=2875764 RepID=UPI001CCCE219|nr:hypothetical protein [Macrococcus armenti]UBH21557.1 hypothetical protein LAU42_07075 [Macrococcus armenti]